MGQTRLELAETRPRDARARAKALEAVLGRLDGFGVSIEGEDARRRALGQDRLRVAAAADGGVDEHAAAPRLEREDDLERHDADVLVGGPEPGSSHRHIHSEIAAR